MKGFPRLVAATVVVGAALLVVAGIGSGTITRFLSPSVVPRTAVGAAVLIAMAVIWAVRGLRHHATDRSAIRSVWPVVVPLVLLPAALASTSAEQSRTRPLAVGRGTTAAIGSGTSWVEAPNPDLAAAVDSVYEAEHGVPPAPPPRDAERAAAIAALAAVDGPIVVDAERFSRRVNLIWDDPDRFVGHAVRLEGFVYRRPDWPLTTFVAARMLMWCCAADAAVIGIPVAMDTAATAPETGQWIAVEGTLAVRDSFVSGVTRMEHLPEIRSATWRPISVPRQEYVFPE